MPLSSSSVLAPRRLLGALLTAFAASACDGSEATGPQVPLVIEDDVRLASITIRDTTLSYTTRNQFIYDDAGRLIKVEFRVSQSRGGPPDWLTRYSEHLYDGDRLRETRYHGLRTSDDRWVNYAAREYEHDAQGRLKSTRYQEVLVSGVRDMTTNFTHDGRGRISGWSIAGSDRMRFEYDSDGVLASGTRTGDDGTLFHERYQHDTGRNPFYGRTAHVFGIITPLFTWPELLSPTNLLRLENRVGADPTVISSARYSYEYDEDGRPLHVTLALFNDYDPTSRGTWFFIDYEYEPAN